MSRPQCHHGLFYSISLIFIPGTTYPLETMTAGTPTLHTMQIIKINPQSWTSHKNTALRITRLLKLGAMCLKEILKLRFLTRGHLTSDWLLILHSLEELFKTGTGWILTLIQWNLHKQPPPYNSQFAVSSSAVLPYNWPLKSGHLLQQPLLCYPTGGFSVKQEKLSCSYHQLPSYLELWWLIFKILAHLAFQEIIWASCSSLT